MYKLGHQYRTEMKEAFIPNKEIIGEFENAMGAGGWSEVVRVLQESEKLLEDSGDIEAVCHSFTERHS